ncbi:MAG TPA: L,D-transpeptidase [Xanthobacteraceae bacterium]|nr:L,D-transpeptidase [Xanthobacteraceae bacterium]
MPNPSLPSTPSIIRRLVLASFAACLAGSAAEANVLVAVDKSRQQMTVSVDGMPRYRWVVSTGRAGYGTPNGTYHPVRLERQWFSKEYYNSPMPYSIFFRGGYAIHGSYEISRLGGPASHGCIRLHPSDAARLFALVKQEGIGNTTIVVSGHNPVVARRSVRQPPAEDARRAYGEDDGQPLQISPYGPPRYPSGYTLAPSEPPPPRRGFVFPFFDAF